MKKLIVFLHGVGSSSSMWRSHIENLKDYECIALDLPGHGKNNKTRWTSLDKVSEEIYRLIVSSKQKKAHLVGLSLGGALIINLMSKHPEVVDRAIIDGAGVHPIKGIGLIKTGVKMVSGLLKYDRVNRIVAKAVGVEDEYNYQIFRKDMKAVDPKAFANAFAQANDQLEPEGWSTIECPTLFVAGEHEPKEVLESQKYLANKMKNGECRVVPGVSHGWLAEKTDLHVEMTRAWLDDRELPKELKVSKTNPAIRC